MLGNGTAKEFKAISDMRKVIFSEDVLFVPGLCCNNIFVSRCQSNKKRSMLNSGKNATESCIATHVSSLQQASVGINNEQSGVFKALVRASPKRKSTAYVSV